MKRTSIFISLMCASLVLGACSALDKIGDKIDDDCRSGGTLETTQKYLDTWNQRLSDKGRLFRIDGITCLE